MAVGPSAPSDDTDGTGLARVEAHAQGDGVGTEDTELGGGSDEHQLRVGNQGREVGHGTDTQEDERRIPALYHTLIENVEYRPFFVDTQLQAGIFERYVTDEDTESDGDKQHGLKFFRDGQIDEEAPEKYHDEVAPHDIGETCIGEKFLNVLS